MSKASEKDAWRSKLAEQIFARGFVKGMELGVKRGRSMEYLLRGNPALLLDGLDTWRSAPAYRFPFFDHFTAWLRLRPFAGRARLFKGPAAELASRFEDRCYDFVHYDVFNFRISSVALHTEILKAWLPKIRSSGHIFGRDFGHEHLQEAFAGLGLKDHLKPLAPDEPALSRMQFLEVSPR